MSDLTPLSRFHENQEPVKPVMRTTGVILAFDQSLANTGWCLIGAGGVLEVGNIKTTGEGKGHADNLRRAVELFSATFMLIMEHQPDRVVHELPPVGSRMVRPESSLLASLAIWIASHITEKPVTMIGAQKAKKRWTGNARADKAEVKKALLELHPYLATMKPMNQAISDAIAVGLVAVEEMHD